MRSTNFLTCLLSTRPCNNRYVGFYGVVTVRNCCLVWLACP